MLMNANPIGVYQIHESIRSQGIFGIKLTCYIAAIFAMCSIINDLMVPIVLGLSILRTSIV